MVWNKKYFDWRVRLGMCLEVVDIKELTNGFGLECRTPYISRQTVYILVRFLAIAGMFIVEYIK